MIDTINKVLDNYSDTRITNRIKSALAAITPDDRPRLGRSPSNGPHLSSDQPPQNNGRWMSIGAIPFVIESTGLVPGLSHSKEKCLLLCPSNV